MVIAFDIPSFVKLSDWIIYIPQWLGVKVGLHQMTDHGVLPMADEPE
jgi:hypothetical protein